MSNAAIDSARDTTKQIITLSTAMLGLTITFSKTFTPEGQTVSLPCTLLIAWVLYGVTIFSGVWTLMAITGTLNNQRESPNSPDANANNIRIPALVMVLSFFLAIVFTIATGFQRFS